MKLRSIDAMPDIRGKNILVRVDHNVECDEKGSLKDDLKLRVTLPTLEFLVSRGARVILMTHIGRPKGKVDESLRTKAVAMHLKTLSPKFRSIISVSEITGDIVKKELNVLKDGDMLYLENVRFSPHEEGNDQGFIDALSSLGDFYVNEAFPSLHTYEESSTCGLARKLPAYAGYHLQKEVEKLSEAIEDPRRPLLLIMSGGAKMKTKIPVIRRFLDIADDILLGGCIANTFIAARGFDVGESKYEKESIDLCQELMLESEQAEKAKIHVPRDVVVASEASADAEKLDLPLEDVTGDMKIFDIGKVSLERYKKEIDRAQTIIWNGPLGYYELNRFSHATKRLAEYISDATNRGAFTVIGGGDTLDFHAQYGYPTDRYSFVSLGGGAMLEFLSSKMPLPGLLPLTEKGSAVAAVVS